MLKPEYRDLLLCTAAQSIKHGLREHKPLSPDVQNAPQELTQHRACFVTLNLNDKLRGCIGSLEAYRPLLLDAAANAYASAFSDPRFSSLTIYEYPQLDIAISVLSEAQPMEFSSEEDLLSQLRPGVDGLIMEEGMNRGTFLPTVWDTLPSSKDFLQHLKLKAGLSLDYWSNTMRVFRYSTETFSRSIQSIERLLPCETYEQAE